MITAALIGNPNSGKTTVFNKLTGSVQHVGNWPGVTVDRKQGFIRNYRGESILVVDLPGIYSLSPYSPEEIVSRDYLLGNTELRPDVAINIIDASNIERAIYLMMQVVDLGMPMVLVLNMVDVAEKNGMRVSKDKLEEVLGIEVLETVGVKGEGVAEIGAAIKRAHEENRIPRKIAYGDAIEAAVGKISEVLRPVVRDGLERWTAIKVIENDQMVVDDLGEETVSKCKPYIDELREKTGTDGLEAIATARYDAAERIKSQVITHFTPEKETETSISDRIDNVLLNKWASIPIFIVVMFLVYFVSIQTIGTWGSDWINDTLTTELSDAVSSWCEENEVADALTGLVVDGIIAGVMAIIGFLPQIIVLFLCLAFLEECGYMSRVAYILDRVFYHFGLSGKNVIPMVIGIGCGVPGIMGTRTIEDEQNRRISAMTTTFMPCSAKLPIITTVAAAFFHESAIVALAMYLLGIVAILMSGIILKKFSGLTGKPSPFVMELPVYHIPTARNVLMDTGQKSWAFVRKAGTLILLSAVLIWALSSYDWGLNYLESNSIDGSILADVGKALNPIFAWSGFGDHWEITVASITGLLAKENLLGTLAVLLNDAGDADGFITSAALADYCSANTALAFVVFNCICAPCFAAIGAMHRELGSWKDTGYAVCYQCLLAWGLSIVTYQFLELFSGRIHAGIIAAIAVLIVLGYFLLAKDPVGAIKRKAGGLERRGEAA